MGEGLSSCSEAQVTISPQFHREFDSSRVIQAALLLLPLLSGQGQWTGCSGVEKKAVAQGGRREKASLYSHNL